jgi:galactose mutarotase-like enzyme
MMTIWTLENPRWHLSIASIGGEMQHLTDKLTGRERLWQPVEGIWTSRAPLLFPVVGRLVHDGLWEDDRFYPLPAHGFLRTQSFYLQHTTTDSLRLRSQSTPATLAVWPFRYAVEASWTLRPESVQLCWRILNEDEQPFGFSLGYHPGFALPVASETGWRVTFTHAPVQGPWPTRNRTLQIPDISSPVTEFALTADTFRHGAIYFSQCEGAWVSVTSPQGNTVLMCQLSNHPWLALWGVPGADLLCIEPLAGTTDDPAADGKLAHKRGIQWLSPGEVYEQQLSLIFPADEAHRDG